MPPQSLNPDHTVGIVFIDVVIFLRHMATFSSDHGNSFKVAMTKLVEIAWQLECSRRTCSQGTFLGYWHILVG